MCQGSVSQRMYQHWGLRMQNKKNVLEEGMVASFVKRTKAGSVEQWPMAAHTCDLIAV